MRKQTGITLIELMILLTIFAILFVVFGRGLFLLTDSKATSVVEATERQGYTDIQITDRSIVFVGLRGCGDDDTIVFEAKATNALGQRVDIIMCSGYFKGVTVRTM